MKFADMLTKCLQVKNVGSWDAPPHPLQRLYFAETCLVPFFHFFHVGAPTLPHLPPRKWTLSKVNYLTYPMCKEPTCDPLQKSSKRRKWVTFFRLIENYIHFLYSKRGKIVTGSKIDMFEEEDEKCYIQKCNQWVTYLRLICDSLRPMYNLSILTLWSCMAHL